MGPGSLTMRKTTRTLSILLATALVVAGVSAFAISRITTGSSAYFAETGQTVREPFLTYFEESGGTSVLGYPITPDYEADTGVRVQTFQNVQLQLTVRGVQTAPIGAALMLEGVDGTYSVASEFEAFHDALGGEAFFGQPIDALRNEQGVLVQDFENARIIEDEQGVVRLAQLGAVYAQIFPPQAFSGQASLQLVLTPESVTLNPAVTIDQPTLSAGEQQTIYISVRDQNNQPVEGVQVLAILSFDEALAEVEFNPTNADGLTSATFLPPQVDPGTQVLIEVHLLLGNTFRTVQSTYTQWY